MLKLFLKKVIYTAVFLTTLFLIAAAITWCVQNLLHKLPDSVKGWIIAIPPTVITLGTVYYIRLKNARKKQSYLGSIKKSWPYVSLSKLISEKENLLHTGAFALIALAFFLTMGISANTPFWYLVAGTVILLLFSVVIFYLVNTIIWYAVYSSWLKEYVREAKEAQKQALKQSQKKKHR